MKNRYDLSLQMTLQSKWKTSSYISPDRQKSSVLVNQRGKHFFFVSVFSTTLSISNIVWIIENSFYSSRNKDHLKTVCVEINSFDRIKRSGRMEFQYKNISSRSVVQAIKKKTSLFLLDGMFCIKELWFYQNWLTFFWVFIYF